MRVKITYEQRMEKLRARDREREGRADVTRTGKGNGKSRQVVITQASPIATEQDDPFKWANIRKARWEAAEERRFKAAKMRDPWAMRRNPPDTFPSEIHPNGSARRYQKFLDWDSRLGDAPTGVCGCDNCKYEWVIEKVVANSFGFTISDMQMVQKAMAALQVKAETGKWPWDGGQ